MKKLLGIIFYSLVVLSGCTFNSQDKYVKVTEKVLPSCVEIIVTGDLEVYTLADLLDGNPPKIVTRSVLGAGVFVSPKGYILTCAHLFNTFKKIRTITVESPTRDIQFGSLKIVGNSVDLALVKIYFDSVNPFVKVADPKKLKVGQEVIAIGSPMGLSFSVTNGIISALYRDFDSAYNVTQSNTAINPGNSGGPLFNLRGELVGINSLMIPPLDAPIFTGLGFSVQSGQILEFLVKAGKKYPELKSKKWIDVLYSWK